MRFIRLAKLTAYLRNQTANRWCSFGSITAMVGTRIAVSTSVRASMGQPSVSGKTMGISRLIRGYTKIQLSRIIFHFLGAAFMGAKVRGLA